MLDQTLVAVDMDAVTDQSQKAHPHGTAVKSLTSPWPSHEGSASDRGHLHTTSTTQKAPRSTTTSAPDGSPPWIAVKIPFQLADMTDVPSPLARSSIYRNEDPHLTQGCKCLLQPYSQHPSRQHPYLRK